MTTKIRQAARGEDCAVRIPFVCNGDPETVVLAHAPSVDSGMARKSPDWWGAFCCSNCHDYLDGRRGSADPEWANNRAKYWLSGIFETQKKLRDKGLI